MKTRVCRRLFLPEKLLFTHTEKWQSIYVYFRNKNVILERSLSLVIRITLNKLPISLNCSFVPSEKKGMKELPICATSTNKHHTSKHITPSYSRSLFIFWGKTTKIYMETKSIISIHPLQSKGV